MHIFPETCFGKWWEVSAFTAPDTRGYGDCQRRPTATHRVPPRARRTGIQPDKAASRRGRFRGPHCRQFSALSPSQIGLGRCVIYRERGPDNRVKLVCGRRVPRAKHAPNIAQAHACATNTRPEIEAASGRVDRSLKRHQTGSAACYRHAQHRFRFPPPQSAGHRRFRHAHRASKQGCFNPRQTELGSQNSHLSSKLSKLTLMLRENFL